MAIIHSVVVVEYFDATEIHEMKQPYFVVSERPRMQSYAPPELRSIPSLRSLQEQEAFPPQILRRLSRAGDFLPADAQHHGEGGIPMRR
ncbi:hypothetical protein NQ317_011967 [Molorchus minor]|uniref:Uncharacterized protein n=1 Tax=Molorchus minor TaxID=1323400 RepID=A0ABQ9IU59_9CUCU|nr:hypothetical protein NQ317_011967 [Molorchus minor]